MWSIARRWSSRCRRRRSSVSTWARSPPAAGAAAPGSVTAVSVAISCVTIRPSPTSGGRLFPQAVERLFQGDHLQFAPDHHLLEFLQVQDLLLQLRLGLLEVPDHLLVGPHVAEYADGADDLAVGVAEGGGVEGGGDDLAAGAAGVEAGVAGHPALDDLAEGGGELAGFLGADEAGERLLEQLVWAKAQEGRDRVVSLQDLPFEVGDEDGVRGVLDEALGIGAGFVELPHVAEDADGADDLAVGVAEGGGVEGGGDDLAAGAARVEAGVAGHPPLDNFPQGGHELSGFLGGDEAGERLLEHLSLAKPEELRDRVVGLHDFAFEVGNEHRIRSVGDDDVGIQRALPFSTLGVSNDPRLRTEFKPSSHFELLPHGSAALRPLDSPLSPSDVRSRRDHCFSRGSFPTRQACSSPSAARAG